MTALGLIMALMALGGPHTATAPAALVHPGQAHVAPAATPGHRDWEADEDEEDPGTYDDEGDAAVERDSQQAFFPLTFSDDLLPYTEANKWTFLVVVAAASSFGLPLADLWLPVVMWDPKPKLDFETVIKPWFLQSCLPTLIGHLILVACCCAIPIWIIPFYGWVASWIIFVWSLLLCHLPWRVFNYWRGGIASLQVWDNALRLQGLADEANDKVKKPRRSRRHRRDDNAD